MASWDVISTLDSPTSGTFIFTSLSLGAYSVLQIKAYGLTVTTDGTDTRVTFYVGGSEVTSTYRWATQQISSGGTSNNDGLSAQASMLVVSNDANWDFGNDTGEGGAFTMNVDNPASTSLHKRAGFETWGTGPTGNVVYTVGGGILGNTGAIDGVKIGGTSNLTAGKVRLLGLA